jgi:hypothetical protein
LILHHLRSGELNMMRFLFQNPVADAACPQPRLIGLGIVGFVGIDVCYWISF